MTGIDAHLQKTYNAGERADCIIRRMIVGPHLPTHNTQTNTPIFLHYACSKKSPHQVKGAINDLALAALHRMAGAYKSRQQNGFRQTTQQDSLSSRAGPVKKL